MSLLFGLILAMKRVNEDKLLAFVDEFCRVKKLFREDIVVDISLAP